MFLCVVYGLLPLKTVSAWYALNRKYIYLSESLSEVWFVEKQVMFRKQIQNYT